MPSWRRRVWVRVCTTRGVGVCCSCDLPLLLFPLQRNSEVGQIQVWDLRMCIIKQTLHEPQENPTNSHMGERNKKKVLLTVLDNPIHYAKREWPSWMGMIKGNNAWAAESMEGQLLLIHWSVMLIDWASSRDCTYRLALICSSERPRTCRLRSGSKLQPFTNSTRLTLNPRKKGGGWEWTSYSTQSLLVACDHTLYLKPSTGTMSIVMT